MSIGKPQGIMALVLGLLLLTYGVLILFYVPSWGRWIADYPLQMANAPVPPEAAPILQVMSGVFGPVLVQVGGYMQAIEYFAGSLVTIVSLVPISVDAQLIRGEHSPRDAEKVSSNPVGL